MGPLVVNNLAPPTNGVMSVLSNMSRGTDRARMKNMWFGSSSCHSKSSGLHSDTDGLLSCWLSPGLLCSSIWLSYSFTSHPNPHMLLNTSGGPPSHCVLPSQVLTGYYLGPLDATRCSYGLQLPFVPGCMWGHALPRWGRSQSRKMESPTTPGPQVFSQGDALCFSSWIRLLLLATQVSCTQTKHLQLLPWWESSLYSKAACRFHWGISPGHFIPGWPHSFSSNCTDMFHCGSMDLSPPAQSSILCSIPST